MLVRRVTSDRPQLTRLDLIRQSYCEHADPGSLDRLGFSGCCPSVLRLSVGNDDADVVHVRTVAVVPSEDFLSEDSESQVCVCFRRYDFRVRNSLSNKSSLRARSHALLLATKISSPYVHL